MSASAADADAYRRPIPPETKGLSPVLVPVPRCRQDDIAHEGQRSAVDDIGRNDVVDDGRLVLLEEAGRIDDEPFDAERAGSEERDGAAQAPVDLVRGLFVIEQRGVALEGEAEKRREQPVGASSSGHASDKDSGKSQGSEVRPHREPTNRGGGRASQRVIE